MNKFQKYLETFDFQGLFKALGWTVEDEYLIDDNTSLPYHYRYVASLKVRDKNNKSPFMTVSDTKINVYVIDEQSIKFRQNKREEKKVITKWITQKNNNGIKSICIFINRQNQKSDWFLFLYDDTMVNFSYQEGQQDFIEKPLATFSLLANPKENLNFLSTDSLLLSAFRLSPTQRKLKRLLITAKSLKSALEKII